MNTPDKCPKCGADAMTYGSGVTMECGTWVGYITGGTDESRDCLARQRDQLLARVKRLEGALVSIQEYWNRDENERAMSDACWHAINTAAEALEAKEAKP